MIVKSVSQTRIPHLVDVRPPDQFLKRETPDQFEHGSHNPFRVIYESLIWNRPERYQNALINLNENHDPNYLIIDRGIRRTILGTCVNLGRVDQVKEWLARGADPNLPVDTFERRSNTCLQLIIEQRNYFESSVATQLWEIIYPISNLEHRNEDGLTASDLCILKNQPIWLRQMIFDHPSLSVSPKLLLKHSYLRGNHESRESQDEFRELLTCFHPSQLSWLYLHPLPNITEILQNLKIPRTPEIMLWGMRTVRGKLIRDCLAEGIRLSLKFLRISSYWETVNCLRILSEYQDARELLPYLNDQEPIQRILSHFINIRFRSDKL